jgi:hypothetical protein
MTMVTPDETALLELARKIEALSPRPHHNNLMDIANLIHPGCTFEYALNRGGWYRHGGVIAPNGDRLSNELEPWARAELEACGGDMAELVERYVDKGLQVTRHSGRTHYFVCPYGPAPADFMQLEVEELQEVLDRELIDPDALPEDMQELIDPISPQLLDGEAVGSPRYKFRRLLDMKQTVARVGLATGRDAGLPRLLKEWSHSSAATRGPFCEHWVVGLREHMDRYRNPVVTASLVSRHARELKSFQWNAELSGVEMSHQLQAFDRAAGYPSAWYFHLVSNTITPPAIAYAVVRNLESGFSYLPDTEAALVQGWAAAPYSV